MVANAGEVVYLPNNTSMPITVKAREFEVFTVVPVKEMWNGVKFAPIGLIKMFNSGGAIKDLSYESGQSATSVSLKIRGCGPFGAYSSCRPKRITVDSEEADFEYEEAAGLVTLSLGVPEEELYLWSIGIYI